MGKELSQNRAKVYNDLEKKLNELLVKMNMPNAQIKIESNQLKEPSLYGLEDILFYARTNLGSPFEPLRKLHLVANCHE
jgi:DNA repair protein RecN (Recombination protein N)